MQRADRPMLERSALADYLDELDHSYGTIPDDLVEHYGALWPPPFASGEG